MSSFLLLLFFFFHMMLQINTRAVYLRTNSHKWVLEGPKVPVFLF